MTTTPETAPITPPLLPPALPTAIKLTATQFTQLLTEEAKRTTAYDAALKVHQEEMVRLARIQQAVMVETHKLIRYQAEHMMTPRAHIVLALLSARMATAGSQVNDIADLTVDLQAVVEGIMTELFKQSGVPAPEAPIPAAPAA